MLPLMLLAKTMNVHVEMEMPAFDTAANSFERTVNYGSITAPGKWQLPVRTINIALPAGAEVLSHSYVMNSESMLPAAEPNINPGFSNDERVLTASPQKSSSAQVVYQGTGKWGDVVYASFRILPARYSSASSAYIWNNSLEINLEYRESEERGSNILPETLQSPEFFVNPTALKQMYRRDSAKNYKYLIVTTPQLYAAAFELVAFRQSQGLITAFADISTILQTSPGANDPQRLRNYLVTAYAQNHFSYILLVGDYDVVPVAMLTPEPDGMDTVPSDFYYSDLSSNFDSDSDGRLGEYSTGVGNQDWQVDFTPEAFVGRISLNTPADVSTVCQRIVAFEQSTAAWKNKTLLPAAFLNYAGEGPNNEFLQTDGADMMELVKSTVLNGKQNTTMYEHFGVVSSHPSTGDVGYDAVTNLLRQESFGLINWSAHGSPTSSARKVWVADTNGDNIPNDNEMQWMGLVDNSSFDNIETTDGAVIFGASCYNGMIDHSAPSLAEYALQKKGVATIGATRTGWYKIGWKNPGWGGLTSYNYHFLENYVKLRMSVGAALSYANLLHSQYYFFGDPVDSDGIIWPELQNIYTYLLYGDPAIGYSATGGNYTGEILVWEPNGADGIAVINAINAVSSFNVIYTDKLIPDYDYLDNFAAVFCLLGFGTNTYTLQPNSLEHTMLNSYLDNGGKVYMEGNINWMQNDPLFSKFGTTTPFTNPAFIERLRFRKPPIEYRWTYISEDMFTQAMWFTGDQAVPIISSFNTAYANDIIAVWNTNGSYRTISSSFRLGCIIAPSSTLSTLVRIIIDTLNVQSTAPVANSDEYLVAASLSLSLYPNPFHGSVTADVKNIIGDKARIDVYNIRGQKVYTKHYTDIDKTQTFTWDARDWQGRRVSNGIYLIKVSTGAQSKISKAILIK